MVLRQLPKESNFMTTRQVLVNKLQEFIENEARSCTMDFGCISPLYVYRMWGGAVAYDEIENALNYLKANNYGY